MSSSPDTKTIRDDDAKVILDLKDKALVLDAVRAFFSTPVQSKAAARALNSAVKAALVEHGNELYLAQRMVTRGGRYGEKHPGLWGAYIVLGGDRNTHVDANIDPFFSNRPTPAGHVPMTRGEMAQLKAKVSDILKAAEDKEKAKKQKSASRASSAGPSSRPSGSPPTQFPLPPAHQPMDEDEDESDPVAPPADHQAETMDEDESLQAMYRELQLENRRLRALNQQLSEENSTLRGKVNAMSADFTSHIIEQRKPDHDELIKLREQAQRDAETIAALRAQLDASEKARQV